MNCLVIFGSYEVTERFLKNVARVDALLKQKEYAEVIERSAALLLEQPNDVHLLRLHGFANLESGKIVQAKKSLERALKYDTNRGRAFFSLGLVHRQAGRYEEAASCFLKARTEFAGTASTTTDFDSWIRLERYLVDQGEVAPAILAALTAFPTDKPNTLNWLKQAYAAGLSQEDVVQTAYDSYAEEYPDDEEVCLLQLELLIANEGMQEAKEFLEDMPGLLKSTPLWKRYRAKIEWELVRSNSSPSVEQVEAVFKMHEALLQQDFQRDELLVRLSRASLSFDKAYNTQFAKKTSFKSQARDLLFAAYRESSGGLETSLALADFLIRVKDELWAWPLLKSLLSSHPENDTVRGLAARYYMGTHDPEEAVHHAQKGLEASAQSRECLFQLSQAYFSLGRYQESYGVLLEYLKFYPEDQLALKHAGNLEYTLGIFNRAEYRVRSSSRNGMLPGWAELLERQLSKIRRIVTAGPGENVIDNLGDRIADKLSSRQFRGKGKLLAFLSKNYRSTRVLALILSDNPDAAEVQLTRETLSSGLLRPKKIDVQQAAAMKADRSWKQFEWVAIVPAGVKLAGDALLEMAVYRPAHAGLVVGTCALGIEEIESSSSGGEEVLLVKSEDLQGFHGKSFSEAINRLRQVLHVHQLPGLVQAGV